MNDKDVKELARKAVEYRNWAVSEFGPSDESNDDNELMRLLFKLGVSTEITKDRYDIVIIEDCEE